MNSLFTPPLDVDFLFKIGDLDGDGKIGTAEACQFFQYTNLPQTTLATIWSLSVPPKKPMDSFHFITALRYIAFAQKGIKIEKQLLEGRNAPYDSPTINCPFLLSSNKIVRITKTFEKLTNSNKSKVTKTQLLEIIIKINDSINVDDIMKLCDLDGDNELNIVEFSLAIVCLQHYISYKQLPIKIPIYFISYIEKNVLLKQETQPKNHNFISKRPKSHTFNVPSLNFDSQQLSIEKLNSNDSEKNPQKLSFATADETTILSSSHHKKSLTPKLPTISPPPKSSKPSISTSRSSLKKKSPSSSSEIFVIEKLYEQKPFLKTPLTQRGSMMFTRSPSLSPRSRQRKSIQFTISPSLSPHINEPILKSDLIYRCCSISPFLSEDELTPYQKSRRQSIMNIDQEMSFPSFSFSEDTTLSLDEKLQLSQSSLQLNKTQDLDSILSSLSTQKAELLAEISELQQSIDKLTNELTLLSE